MEKYVSRRDYSVYNRFIYREQMKREISKDRKKIIYFIVEKRIEGDEGVTQDIPSSISVRLLATFFSDIAIQKVPVHHLHCVSMRTFKRCNVCSISGFDIESGDSG